MMLHDMSKIPKLIHYCWFGGKDKPHIVNKCIISWNKYLPDYKIMEWNEENFDIHSNSYVKEAYASRKFAFVSDYVRVHALYYYGGIYLDTDVEVFKSFDDFLLHDTFWGFEQENFIATSTIGSAKGNPLIKVFLDEYKDKSFINEDGSLNELTNVALVTKILKEIGLKTDGQFQVIKDIGAFYPQTYFSPYDYINCRRFITENTYALHHFYKSWLPFRTRVKTNCKAALAKMVGGDNILKLRELLSK
jgi:hypothetical protein